MMGKTSGIVIGDHTRAKRGFFDRAGYSGFDYIRAMNKWLEDQGISSSLDPEQKWGKYLEEQGYLLSQETLHQAYCRWIRSLSGLPSTDHIKKHEYSVWANDLPGIQEVNLFNDVANSILNSIRYSSGDRTRAPIMGAAWTGVASNYVNMGTSSSRIDYDTDDFTHMAVFELNTAITKTNITLAKGAYGTGVIGHGGAVISSSVYSYQLRNASGVDSIDGTTVLETGKIYVAVVTVDKSGTSYMYIAEIDNEFVLQGNTMTTTRDISGNVQGIRALASYNAGSFSDEINLYAVANIKGALSEGQVATLKDGDVTRLKAYDSSNDNICLISMPDAATTKYINDQFNPTMRGNLTNTGMYLSGEDYMSWGNRFGYSKALYSNTTGTLRYDDHVSYWDGDSGRLEIDVGTIDRNTAATDVLFIARQDGTKQILIRKLSGTSTYGLYICGTTDPTGVEIYSGDKLILDYDNIAETYEFFVNGVSVGSGSMSSGQGCVSPTQLRYFIDAGSAYYQYSSICAIRYYNSSNELVPELSRDFSQADATYVSFHGETEDYQGNYVARYSPLIRSTSLSAFGQSPCGKAFTKVSQRLTMTGGIAKDLDGTDKGIVTFDASRDLSDYSNLENSVIVNCDNTNAEIFFDTRTGAGTDGLLFYKQSNGVLFEIYEAGVKTVAYRTPTNAGTSDINIRPYVFPSNGVGERIKFKRRTDLSIPWEDVAFDDQSAIVVVTEGVPPATLDSPTAAYVGETYAGTSTLNALMSHICILGVEYHLQSNGGYDYSEDHLDKIVWDSPFNAYGTMDLNTYINEANGANSGIISRDYDEGFELDRMDDVFPEVDQGYVKFFDIQRLDDTIYSQLIDNTNQDLWIRIENDEQYRVRIGNPGDHKDTLIDYEWLDSVHLHWYDDDTYHLDIYRVGNRMPKDGNTIGSYDERYTFTRDTTNLSESATVTILKSQAGNNALRGIVSKVEFGDVDAGKTFEFTGERTTVDRMGIDIQNWSCERVYSAKGSNGLDYNGDSIDYPNVIPNTGHDYDATTYQTPELKDFSATVIASDIDGERGFNDVLDKPGYYGNLLLFKKSTWEAINSSSDGLAITNFENARRMISDPVTNLWAAPLIDLATLPYDTNDTGADSTGTVISTKEFSFQSGPVNTSANDAIRIRNITIVSGRTYLFSVKAKRLANYNKGRILAYYDIPSTYLHRGSADGGSDTLDENYAERKNSATATGTRLDFDITRPGTLDAGVENMFAKDWKCFDTTLTAVAA